MPFPSPTASPVFVSSGVIFNDLDCDAFGAADEDALANALVEQLPAHISSTGDVSGVSCAADSNGGSASVLNARRRRLDDTASATVSFTLTVSAVAGDDADAVAAAVADDLDDALASGALAASITAFAGAGSALAGATIDVEASRALVSSTTAADDGDDGWVGDDGASASSKGSTGMVTLLIVAAAVALLMAIVCVVANRKLCVGRSARPVPLDPYSSAQVAVPAPSDERAGQHAIPVVTVVQPSATRPAKAGADPGGIEMAQAVEMRALSQQPQRATKQAWVAL